jgi:hypothetical protein
MDRPPLVGIVVRVEDSSLDERRAKYINSQNDRFRYYINWMGTDYPASRWGNRSWLSDRESYFFRNDLKYVRSKK